MSYLLKGGPWGGGGRLGVKYASVTCIPSTISSNCADAIPRLASLVALQLYLVSVSLAITLFTVRVLPTVAKLLWGAATI